MDACSASVSSSISAPGHPSSSRSSMAHRPTEPACERATSSPVSTTWRHRACRSTTWPDSCAATAGSARRASASNDRVSPTSSIFEHRPRGRGHRARQLGQGARQRRRRRAHRAVLAGGRRACPRGHRGRPLRRCRRASCSTCAATRVASSTRRWSWRPRSWTAGVAYQESGPGRYRRATSAHPGRARHRARTCPSSCSSTTRRPAAPRSWRQRCVTTAAPPSSANRPTGRARSSTPSTSPTARP